MCAQQQHMQPALLPVPQFLVERLAGVLERRAEANSKAKASGLIINTLGWVDGLGYELQMHAVSALKVRGASAYAAALGQDVRRLPAAGFGPSPLSSLPSLHRRMLCLCWSKTGCSTKSRMSSR